MGSHLWFPERDWRRTAAKTSTEVWSGRADLNRGPPAPKAGALPGCATPRHDSIINETNE
jgi:hypothetical protein